MSAAPHLATSPSAQDRLAEMLRAEPIETLRRIADQDRIRSIQVLDIRPWCDAQYELRADLMAAGMSLDEAGARKNAIIADLARAEIEARA